MGLRAGHVGAETQYRVVLQCVAMCCSVLQCVVVCCSVLQCVAACCSVLQCVAFYVSRDSFIRHNKKRG